MDVDDACESFPERWERWSLAEHLAGARRVAGQCVDVRGTHWASRWASARRPVLLGPAGLKNFLKKCCISCQPLIIGRFRMTVFSFETLGELADIPYASSALGAGSPPPSRLSFAWQPASLKCPLSYLWAPGSVTSYLDNSLRVTE